MNKNIYCLLLYFKMLICIIKMQLHPRTHHQCIFLIKKFNLEYHHLHAFILQKTIKPYVYCIVNSLSFSNVLLHTHHKCVMLRNFTLALIIDPSSFSRNSILRTIVLFNLSFNLNLACCHYDPQLHPPSHRLQLSTSCKFLGVVNSHHHAPT